MTRIGLFSLALLLLMGSGCSGRANSAPEGEATTTPPRVTDTAEVVATPSPAERSATEESTRPAPSATPTEAPTPTRTPSPTGETPSHTFDSPEYGVQAFMFWKPDIAQRDLRLIKEMGFGWVKQGFAWRDIEPFEGAEPDWWKPDQVVDQVEAAGLKLLVRLDRQPFWSQEEEYPPLENAPPADLQDFGRFCGAMAERYRGRIAAYQVWNEPNLSREWGGDAPDPVAYTELLRVCYEAIKAADPAAIVISAGLAPTGTTPPIAMPDTQYLQEMYDAGAADYFDVLGANAPGYAAPPEMSPAEAAEEYGHRFFTFRRVEDLREIMVANGDAEKQMAILEMGWTTDQVHPEYSWFAVDEETQADYLVRAYQYAREQWQPWIGLMTTIYIADYDWTPENEQWWWSIVLPDGTPRPAYHALREMEK